jgi:hypothetical protein
MLRSVVEGMGQTGFAQVALILFFSVFLSVLIRESLRSKREVKHLSQLPLADDLAAAPAPASAPMTAPSANRGVSQ